MKKLISLFLSLILVFSLGGVYIVNADTNIAYVSEDGVINGFSGTVYTDVETAISNLGLNGGTIYVEGNIVLPTIPDVQSMIGKEIIFCGYNNLAEGNVVEFTNKTSSFVPNAEVDIIFDNITIKHQDGSTTEDWISATTKQGAAVETEHKKAALTLPSGSYTIKYYEKATVSEIPKPVAEGLTFTIGVMNRERSCTMKMRCRQV